ADVVLEKDGDPVQGASHVTGASFCVQALCDGLGVGIHLDDRVDRRTRLVERLDAREVEVDEVERAQLIARHRRLQLGDCHLVEVRWRRGGRGQVMDDRYRRRPRHRSGAELQNIAPYAISVPYSSIILASSWLTNDT